MATKKITLTEFKDLVKKIIKEEYKLNEISSDTFNTAIEKSKERGTDGRTQKLGSLYFNKFVGKPLMGGVIHGITVISTKQDNDKNVLIQVEKNVLRQSGITKKLNNYTYNVDSDEFNLGDIEIERKDAVILSKIAQHINPDTKYKKTGTTFKIKGW
jgi:hypothetical protein